MRTSSEPRSIPEMLPTEPRFGMVEELLAGQIDELGGNMIIYHRISVTVEPEWKELMTPEDLLAHERNTSRRWAAECNCTACGDTWVTGWEKGGALRLYMGDDGLFYDCPPEEDAGNWTAIEEGTEILCPLCCAQATLIRKSRFHFRRTFQLMACSIENVGVYTALVWWIVRREIYEDGDQNVGALPAYAAVIGRDGTLLYFKRAVFDYGGRLTPGGEAWTSCARFEPEQTRYYDHDSINGNKVGCVYWGDVPEQGGQTGEKTGLRDYILAGGSYPLQYLRWWRRAPEIENLVKAGWTGAISGAICGEIESRLQYGTSYKVHEVAVLGELFNWGAKRPCDLLWMTKAEEREARGYGWSWRVLGLWAEIVDYGIAGPGCARALNDAILNYGLENVLNWEGCVLDGWDDWYLDEFDAYLRKQERKWQLQPALGFEMLIDYRKMLPEDATKEELWPTNLRAAHDALMATAKLKETEELRAGFERIAKKWASLEWSDGRICLRLPRSQSELTDEGRTLNHCVGRYGPEHIRESLILFVRHHRRPERSWFTLNVNVSGNTWYEVQLHGYGNEYAHGKSLRIPDEVRAFVDRWEKEVLTPVFRKVKAAEARIEKKNKKKKENAA